MESVVLPQHLRTLSGAVNKIRRERKQALKMMFPPWYALDTDEMGGRFYVRVLLLMILAGIVVQMANLVSWNPDAKTKAGFLIGFLLATAFRLTFPIVRWSWLRRHPNHPFAHRREREAMRTQHLNPVALKLAAIDLLRRAWLEHCPDERTCVRVERDILDLSEFVGDRCAYRGMRLIGSRAPQPTDRGLTDDEREHWWYEVVAKEVEAQMSMSSSR